MWPFTRTSPPWLIDEAAEPDAFAPSAAPQAAEGGPARVVLYLDDLPAYTRERSVNVGASAGFINNQVRFGFDDGEKFSGGYGPTILWFRDYWTLRARSAEVYQANLYARGLVRRMVTNVINTGLHLECTPEQSIVGLNDDELEAWTEDIETRFELWGSIPKLCDQAELKTWGALQEAAYTEALVSGDVLAVLRINPATGTPRVQLISGSKVRTPVGEEAWDGVNKIVEGVEIDPQGRHVAFWVQQDDGTFKRLPAIGEKSGRRLAWLVYGTDKRMVEVRGTPLLGLALQALKEIDRYRDATLRKAVVNSMIAIFIKKTLELQGSRPLTGGAVRKGVGGLLNDGTNEQVKPREFRVNEFNPGMVMEELQAGEEPVAMSANGTDEKFGAFEEGILQGIAWGYEIPPEILRLSFSSNYSASQAAINEFKMTLNRIRTLFGDGFCQVVYVEWLLAMAQARRVVAGKLLDAWRDPAEWEVYAAWIYADWSGAIKPAVDLSKLVAGYTALLAIGSITRARTTRELTGLRFSKVMKKLERENAMLAIANAHLLPAAKPSDGGAPTKPGEDTRDDRESQTDDEPSEKDDDETDKDDADPNRDDSEPGGKG